MKRISDKLIQRPIMNESEARGSLIDRILMPLF